MGNDRFITTSDPEFAHEKLDVYRLPLEYIELEDRLARAMPAGSAKFQDELDQANGLDQLALFADLYTSWSRYRLHPSLLACSCWANLSRRSRLADFAIAKSRPFSIASYPCS